MVAQRDPAGPALTRQLPPRTIARLPDRALALLRVPLLLGPCALSFFAGGYFGQARSWAGAVAWAVVGLVLLLDPAAGRMGRSARLAVAGLGGLAAWTLLSTEWAPLAGSAYRYAALAILYLGALIAGTVLLRGPAGASLAEPTLAAGALVVIGYGVGGRLLPGILHLAQSASAQGRLEQPLTYWNAMGELAAIGLVLATRLTGDGRRGAGLRMTAAAGCPLLGLGLYASFSRGALFSAAAGLLILVTLSRSGAQFRAAVLAAAAALGGALIGALLPAVSSLHGTLAHREHQGVEALILLAVTGALAAGMARVLTRRAEGLLALPRRSGALVVLMVSAGLAVAIVAGAHEHAGRRPLSAGADRYVTLQSNRYEYWHVALHGFAQEPVRGVGAGGWAVLWLRLRRIPEYAQDAHSLPLQTLAELGLVGLGLLLLFLGGIGWSARNGLVRCRAETCGAAAAFAAWLLHQPLDWDWEMPALTLVGMVLAAALLAAGEERHLDSPPMSPELPPAAAGPRLLPRERRPRQGRRS